MANAIVFVVILHYISGSFIYIFVLLDAYAIYNAFEFGKVKFNNVQFFINEKKIVTFFISQPNQHYLIYDNSPMSKNDSFFNIYIVSRFSDWPCLIQHNRFCCIICVILLFVLFIFHILFDCLHNAYVLRSPAPAMSV